MEIKIVETKNKILGRSGHGAVLRDNKLIIFGGETQKKRLNDINEYDFEKKIWSEIIPKNEKTDLNVPKGVAKFCCVLQKKNKFLYVFGGRGIFKTNELFRFNFEKLMWKKIYTTNSPPRRSSLDGFVLNDKYLFIYAGIGDKKYGDAYILNFKTKCWSNVNISGEYPKVRSSYGSIVEFNKDFYIFGGLTCGQLNDFWKLKIEQNKNIYNFKWEKVQMKSSIKPEKRGRCYNKNKKPFFLIFSGKVGNVEKPDMFVFDFEKCEWKEILLNKIEGINFFFFLII
jgi:hypothetical protein